MMQRRLMAAIIGSGTLPHQGVSYPLGRWLAENGFDLVNGGGQGVMAEAARAFTSVKSKKGLVVGILPASARPDNAEKRKEPRPSPGYPNDHTEIVIRTHLPLVGGLGSEFGSRNHLIVLSADFIFALPGDEGTRSEIGLALDYGKPLVLISPQGEWQEFASRAPRVKGVEAGIQEFEKWLGKRKSRR